MVALSATPSPSIQIPISNARREQLQQGKIFSHIPEDVPHRILVIDSYSIHVLIDSGSTHFFVTPYFATKLSTLHKLLNFTLYVFTPSGDSMIGSHVFRDCDVLLHVNLIPLDIQNFDVILGMNWLNYTPIDCVDKKLDFQMSVQPKLSFKGKDVVPPPDFISYMHAHRFLRKGC